MKNDKVPVQIPYQIYFNCYCCNVTSMHIRGFHTFNSLDYKKIIVLPIGGHVYFLEVEIVIR